MYLLRDSSRILRQELIAHMLNTLKYIGLGRSWTIRTAAKALETAHVRSLESQTLFNLGTRNPNTSMDKILEPEMIYPLKEEPLDARSYRNTDTYI